MSEVSVSFSGVENVQKKMRLLEVGFLGGIEKAVLASTKLVERDAKEKIAKPSAGATGTLARSITGGISKITRRFIEGTVGANQPYAAAIELGRGPSKASGGTPLYKRRPFQIWVKRVLGDESLAFVVARKIHEKGSPKNPYLSPALQKNMTRIRSLIADAMKRTMRGFGE